MVVWTAEELTKRPWSRGKKIKFYISFRFLCIIINPIEGFSKGPSKGFYKELSHYKNYKNLALLGSLATPYYKNSFLRGGVLRSSFSFFLSFFFREDGGGGGVGVKLPLHPPTPVMQETKYDTCVGDFWVLFSGFVRWKVIVNENLSFIDHAAGIRFPDGC